MVSICKIETRGKNSHCQRVVHLRASEPSCKRAITRYGLLAHIKVARLSRTSTEKLGEYGIQKQLAWEKSRLAISLPKMMMAVSGLLRVMKKVLEHAVAMTVSKAEMGFCTLMAKHGTTIP